MICIGNPTSTVRQWILDYVNKKTENGSAHLDSVVIPPSPSPQPSEPTPTIDQVTDEQINELENLEDINADIEAFLDAYAPKMLKTEKRNTKRLPQWFQSQPEEGCPKWDATAEPLDYRTTTTPDTTWLLVSAFDMSYIDMCPEDDVASMQRVFAGMADHVIVLTNREVTNAALLENLEILKGKHACIWYEFSHGGNGYITTCNGYDHQGSAFRNEDILDFITSAKGRVFCMFSSCNAGSVTDFISTDELSNTQPTLKSARLQSVMPTQQSSEEQPQQTIVQWLKDKLERRGQLMSAASPAQKQPMIMLWAATQSGHNTFYHVGSSSNFANAIEIAYNAKDKYPRWENAWEYVKALGKSNASKDESDKDRCIPECYQYGLKHDKIIAWT